ncbi:alpha 1,6 mannopyranosyltransferase [Corynebacterium sphenisci DSM 44792]|uniref:Alpha-(1->6)-mannopyranosyltransferase A n=1 Tax=Corynebacterium sphenisci DSM 44792 TaxID=1437874 RepID=A0A1L7CYS0_9CORY|nr:alpha-(1->6)-mannopyranosyltransferase A [Corynebacterium sphenisci]APT90972.1 alpha 1,6 mannopyranosyltransferase [Corynebacterium sphenisci DSM 44792]
MSAPAGIGPRARRVLADPAPLGAAGAALIAVGSYGAGATRYRGGVVEALGMRWITYGHGFAAFETLIWAGVAALLVAWLRAGRALVWAPGPEPAPPAARLARVRRLVAWWAGPLALAGPVFSRDVYSYLMQGAMVRDGYDPYTQGAAVNPGPMLLEVSADWRNTTTPYGPLHLGIGKWITAAVGDSVGVGVIAFRLLALAGFAAIVWAAPRIARALGGNPALALWLGPLNPLVLLHLVGGMHNEALMVGLVSLATVAALELPRRRGAALAAALVGVAVSLKATAVIALPFLVWVALTRRAPLPGLRDALRRLPGLLAAGLGMTGLAVAVLAAVTWATGTSWGWVGELSGNTKVVNPLAAPSAVAGIISGVMAWIDDSVTFNVVVAVTRRISAVLMLAGLVATWVLFRATPRRNIAGSCAAYGVMVVFNAVTLPWYYASLLVPLGAVRPPRWVSLGAVGATVLLCLSFAGGGNNRLYEPLWMILVTLAAIAAVRWLDTGSLRPPRSRLPGGGGPADPAAPAGGAGSPTAAAGSGEAPR